MIDKPYTAKRREPVFWRENRCPSCGHSSPMIYKPDLLDKNIDCECQSKFNPFRKNTPCIAEWSVAVEKEKLQNIRDLLRIAEEQDILYRKIKENRKLLGYPPEKEDTQPMTTPQPHNLKCETEFFREVESGKKRFELRKNDRNFRKGDMVYLHETVKGNFTNYEPFLLEIQYVLTDSKYGLLPGYCIFCW